MTDETPTPQISEPLAGQLVQSVNTPENRKAIRQIVDSFDRLKTRDYIRLIHGDNTSEIAKALKSMASDHSVQTIDPNLVIGALIEVCGMQQDLIRNYARDGGELLSGRSSNCRDTVNVIKTLQKLGLVQSVDNGAQQNISR